MAHKRIERFTQINKLQEDMGLFEIANLQGAIRYKNNKEGLAYLYDDFREKIIKANPISKEIDINSVVSIQKISLEKAVLIVLAVEYKNNESRYYTTTEISHLINKTFKEFAKNKNNVSRYFNQAYYPYYEIKKENEKNKYKLSPTGYSEAVVIMRGIKDK